MGSIPVEVTARNACVSGFFLEQVGVCNLY